MPLMAPAHEETLSIQLLTNNKYARQVRTCAAGLSQLVHQYTIDMPFGRCLFQAFNIQFFNAVLIVIFRYQCLYCIYGRAQDVYFYFGLSTRTFEVIIIPVVKFLVTCSVSEILEDIKDKDTSHPPSWIFKKSMTSQPG